MSKTDQLERLTDLVLVLLGTNRPLSLAEIVAEVPGYSPNKTAYRGAFERDKKLLREEGIEIETVEIGGDAQTGYRITEEQFYLPKLDLTESEQRALAIAIAGTGDVTGFGRGALAKFGAASVSVSTPLALLEPPQFFGELYDACRTHALVTFSYDGKERQLCPASLRSANGRWYLTGYSIEREAPRVFRIDRFDGEPTLGAPESGLLPDGYDRGAELADMAVEPAASDEEPTMVVAIDKVAAGRVRAELGDEVELAEMSDGRLQVSLMCGNEVFARNWVLSLRDRAELLAPASMRASVLAWLKAIVAVEEPTMEMAIDNVFGMQLPAEDWAPGGEHAGGKTRGEVRFRRLLAIMTFLAQVGEASLQELADRFGLSEQEVVAELELAACCGRPPYTPDMLLDILVDDDRVVASLPEAMALPRRLNRKEGFALSAAGHLIAEIEADPSSPLSSALAKLDQVLGTSEVLVVDVEHGDDLKALGEAIANKRALDIAYYVASRDEMTERKIHPIHVFVDGGRGYVEAFCEKANALRLFRVDRIAFSEDAGAQISNLPDPLSGPGRVGQFLDDVPAVVLRVGPGARWIADSVPSRVTHEEGEVLFIEVAAASQAWLEILLLQGGPAVAVVEPAAMVGWSKTAAAKILANYGD
jgi:predicted DNA-binding transcriptional regulator YafY